eukprot:357105-Chlamydomonas_euryale.AAC.3
MSWLMGWSLGRGAPHGKRPSSAGSIRISNVVTIADGSLCFGHPAFAPRHPPLCCAFWATSLSCIWPTARVSLRMFFCCRNLTCACRVQCCRPLLHEAAMLFVLTVRGRPDALQLQACLAPVPSTLPVGTSKAYGAASMYP